MNRIITHLTRWIAAFVLAVGWGLLGFDGAQAADCTWNGGSGNWSSSATWSCGVVPGPGDTATINSGTVTLDADVTVQNLTLTGGTLTGANSITVTGAMNWTGGALHGTGATNIAAGATLTLNDGPDYLRQQGRAINNAGTATWTTGGVYYWYLENGAVFTNQAGATFNAQANDRIGGVSGTLFNNLGTFIRSGEGTSRIETPFDNSSPTQVTAGVLQLTGGGSSAGAFNTSAGTAVVFDGGTYNLNEGAALGGAGLYRLTNGTLSINGAVGMDNFAQSGGILAGAGALTVADEFTWTGGYQRGIGSTNIAAGGALVLSDGPDYLRQEGRAINNAGTATWTAGGSYYWYLSDGAVFTNQTGAIFNAQADDMLNMYGSGIFNNEGVLVRSGAGASHFNLPFVGSGSVQVTGGVLRLNGGGMGSGAFTVNDLARLEFANGTFSLETGASLGGAGLFSLSGGTLSVNGNTPVANFEQSGGILTGDGQFTVNQLMNWTGGYQRGAGATNIAAGAALSLNDGPDYLRQEGRAINNAGTATWTTGGVYNWYVGDGAVFTNQAGATFNSQANETVNLSGSGAFNNLGTFVRAGPGSSQFNLPFNSSGGVQVTGGALRFNAGGTGSGAFTVSGATTLQFAGGVYNLNTGATLGGAGTVQLTGGTLTINGNAPATNFEQSGGILTGDGAFTISDAFNWFGGYQRGAGATNIAAGGVLTLSDGPDYLRQEGRAINNAGAAAWTTGGGYNWYLSDGAVFTNQTGATFDAQADDRIGVSGSGTLFNNLGTFIRSGAGTSLIQVPFDNSSPTQVTAGVLQLTGGGSSNGVFTASSGAAVEFNGGTYNLDEGAVLGGAGLYRLIGGTLSINGAATVANFEQTGAILTGDGALTVTGVMTWTGGYQRGAGATNIAAGGVLTLSDGPDYLRQEGRAINNAGAAVWTTGGGYNWYLSDGAVFTNQTGATFDAQADDRIGVSGSNNRFNNLGTFTRAGAGTSLIQPPFDNSSPTQVTQGVLQLAGGGSSNGAMAVAGGAALQFGGGAYTFGSDSSITGDGDVTFSGAAATFAGSYVIPGVTTISGGAVSFTATSSVALGVFAQTGGVLHLGNATVSRNFARSGGSFSHTGLLTFNGADIQGLALEAATTFDRLTVNSGVILNETNPASNAAVAGQLTNLGVIRKARAVAGTGALNFGLTGVTIDVTAPDQLTNLQVDRRDVNHPHATPWQAQGRYWSITPTGGGYTVDVTLPQTGADDTLAQACRYTGAAWDCARTSSTPAAVTRTGVTALSDWAVGYPPGGLALAKWVTPNPAASLTPFVYTLLITNSGPGPATSTVLTDSLPLSLVHGLAGNVLMLHLDEAVNAERFQDTSGQGNDGVCTGGACPTAGVAGRFGQAAQFDGVNDSIDAGNPAVLNLTGELSLAAWFKTAAPVGNYRTLVGKWHTAPTDGAYLLGWENSAGLRFCVSNGVRMVCANSGQSYNDGQWHHVAGVWSGTAATIYVDGAPLATVEDATLGPLFVTTRAVRVGSDASASGDRFFNGVIDEVGIYARALAADAVADLHRAGSPGHLLTSQGDCTIGDEVRCTLGRIEAGATVTVTLQALAEEPATQLTNHACVVATEIDPDPSNNCAQATLILLRIKLYLPLAIKE
jgi:hypothetical protein